MNEQGNGKRLFSFDFNESPNLRTRLLAPFEKPLEKLFSLDDLNDVYDRILKPADTPAFIEDALRVLGAEVRVTEEDMARIPAKGPLLVVANHPFGAIEGIILAYVLMSVRTDLKVVANYMLGRIPELRSIFLFVDPFERSSSPKSNIRPTLEAIRWVKKGGALAMFPAGEVSHIRWSAWHVTDPEWTQSAARILRKTEADVLPVFFEGSNSHLFQLAGLVHPKMRTAMLARELVRKRKKAIEVRIGRPIPYAKVRADLSERELTAFLRFRTYALQNRRPPENPRRFFYFGEKLRRPQRIVTSSPRGRMEDELSMLPASQRLIEAHDCSVHYANAWQIPRIIHEIGRLREVTFRREGEGTGKSIDLDPFDRYYLHLFVWHKSKREVVGAYRVGATDEIFPRYGLQGLYTHRLFEYDANLLHRIGPALELGRSFVRPAYQRSYGPLMLLWKGIGAFVCREPKYRILFGPVSVSNRYSAFSRKLLVEFLKANNFHSDLSSWVRARKPLKGGKYRHLERKDWKAFVNGLDELSEIIGDVDTHYAGIPILLKHYLKLGGKILSFNIDPEFSNALDGLILVDLVEGNEKVVRSYMGAENHAKFMEYHRAAAAARQDVHVA